VDHAALEQARRWGCRFVYASSACIYPTTLQGRNLEDVILLEEDQAWPALPESLYGLLKLSGEEMVRAASKQYGVKAGVVRMFNAVGPEFCPIKDRHVIPALIGKLLSFPEKDLDVWGDGTAERSFLDARDAAVALDLVMHHGCDEGYPINIGDPRRISVGELAMKCIQVAGQDHTKIRYNESRPAGVHTRAPSLDRIRRLGWTIQHDLDDMIEWTAEVLRASA
jgi:nucleoside-diphosphate-sugar epimerase